MAVSVFIAPACCKLLLLVAFYQHQCVAGYEILADYFKLVRIGPNNVTGMKCVEEPGVFCLPDAGDPLVRPRANNEDLVTDFHVFVDGTRVCAVREDEPDEAWDTDLEVVCATDANFPVTTLYVGRCWPPPCEPLCVEAPHLYCPEDAPSHGYRVNADWRTAHDRFTMEAVNGSVCLDRVGVDHWGMYLQLVCFVLTTNSTTSTSAATGTSTFTWVATTSSTLTTTSTTSTSAATGTSTFTRVGTTSSTLTTSTTSTSTATRTSTFTRVATTSSTLTTSTTSTSTAKGTSTFTWVATTSSTLTTTSTTSANTATGTSTSICAALASTTSTSTATFTSSWAALTSSALTTGTTSTSTAKVTSTSIWVALTSTTLASSTTSSTTSGVAASSRTIPAGAAAPATTTTTTNVTVPTFDVGFTTATIKVSSTEVAYAETISTTQKGPIASTAMSNTAPLTTPAATHIMVNGTSSVTSTTSGDITRGTQALTVTTSTTTTTRIVGMTTSTRPAIVKTFTTDFHNTATTSHDNSFTTGSIAETSEGPRTSAIAVTSAPPSTFTTMREVTSFFPEGKVEEVPSSTLSSTSIESSEGGTSGDHTSVPTTATATSGHDATSAPDLVTVVEERLFPGDRSSALVEAVSKREEGLVERALSSQEAVSGSAPGLALAAVELPNRTAGDLILKAEGTVGTMAEVLIPASVVLSFSTDMVQRGMRVVGVAAVLHERLLPDLNGSIDTPIEVQGAMTFSFFKSVPGEPVTRVRVIGLEEPIQLIIPAKRTSDSECAYWDETLRTWSSAGVMRVHGANSSALVCNTTHLSMFASIVQGYVKTFECTHINVISSDGLTELLSWDWRAHPTHVAFILLLTLLIGMLVAACVLDYSRLRTNWDDQVFLMVLPSSQSEDFNSEEVETESRFTPATPDSPFSSQRPSLRQTRSSLSAGSGSQGRAPLSPRMSKPGSSPSLGKLMTPSLGKQVSSVSRQLSSTTLAKQLSSASLMRPAASLPSREGTRKCTHDCFAWCKTSSALRDAFDDVASRWFVYISEVRDFVEGLCQGLQVKHDEDEEETESCCERVCKAMLSSMVANFVRRQAAASLGISSELLRFVMESEEMQEVLAGAASKLASGSFRGSKEEHWLELHEVAVDALNNHWTKSAQWRLFPVAVAKLFFVSNPMMTAFCPCHFWNSSLRVLFVAVELLGSIVAATLFFEVSGLATSKRSRSSCSMLTDPQEQIGRLLAIAMTSLLVASIPVCLMSSLHSRRLIKIDYEGSEMARHKLLIWKMQDRILWTIGLAYCVCCTFFIMAFLANVHPAALASWSIVGYASVLQDAVIIPLGVGLLVPVSSMLAVSATSCWRWSEKEEVMYAQRKRWQKRRGNWFGVVDSI